MTSSPPSTELSSQIYEQLSQKFAVGNSAYLSKDWPPNIANFGTTLLRFLIEYLDPTKDIDASYCAGQINQALPNASQKEFGAGVTLEMWSIILGVAGLIPFNHEMQDRLVMLIIQLRDLPESETLPVLSDDIVFKDAKISQLLGLLVTYDDYHAWLGSFTDEAASETQDNSSSAINLDAFIARIYAHGLGDDNLAVRGLWLFRSGPLENSITDTRRLIWGVRTCALWIIYAGKPFYSWRYRPRSDDDDYEQRALKGGEIWNGEPNMNTARWEFWKQRFEQLVQEVPQMDEDTRQMARTAVVLMEKIKAM